MGNGAWRQAPSIHQPVHPHRRGERLPRNLLTLRICGSSPQAWGTEPKLQQVSAPYRFIPTGVGNGPETAVLLSIYAVHPHRRGERYLFDRVFFHVFGSSPQAWGTVSALAIAAQFARFIPTGVGNGDTAIVEGPCQTVHPHRRGERHLLESYKHQKFGSSPQAWGTVQAGGSAFSNSRFIPTGVGNGTTLTPWFAEPTVHPHRRGER